MRSYHITDLTPEDVRRITERLRAMELEAGLEGLYWLPVPSALLSDVQQKHAPDCGPYVMGLEVEDDSLRLEFLVRARGMLRCECVHYASSKLETHMMRYLDDLLSQLGIAV